MALEGRTHLITAIYQVKGWNLYKQTVNKSGKIVSRVYKQQVVEGNRVATMTKTIAGNTRKMSTTFTKATGKTNDLMKALRRAAIVAPVWLLLRSIMMKVIRTISDGAKYWAEFDKAMMKTEQVIHGAMGTISEAVAELTADITNLSIETGISMAKLSSTFYRFGTVGLDFEKSTEGMEAAVKVANVMFGDSDQIARVLAQTYKLLGDSMDATIPSSKRISVIGALMFKLWKDNAFEIGEFTQALQRFLPTANMFNFSVNETSALLATLHSAGLKSSKAGRLLSTSILKMIPNLDKMALTLGVHVNPQLDSTFDVLVRVIAALNEMAAAGKIPVEALKALELFGGVRQRQAPMALVAIYDTLMKNIAAAGIEQGKFNNLLNDMDVANEKILKSHHKQIERFKNLTTLIGQSFVQWITGADDFKNAMDTVNVVMKGLVHPINAVKEALGKLWKGEERWIEEELNRWKALKEAQEAIPFLKLRPEVGRYVPPEIRRPEEAPEEVRKELSRTTEYQLGLLEQELKYIQLQNKGYNKSRIAQEKLNDYLKSKVKLYNTTDRVIAGEVETLNEQEVISLALVGNYEALFNLVQGMAITEEDILKIEKMRQAITIEDEKIAKKGLQLLIQHEANLLKMRGATSRQIVEATIAMNAQLGIGQDALSLLKNQLSLEKSITEEKTKQNRYSSESVKLYEIYQKYGARMAKATQEFLGGKQFDFRSTFGTQLEKILQESFGGRLTQSKIQKWIATTSLRLKEDIIPEISMKNLQLPAITTKIDKITINIKTALKEALGEKGISQDILDQLAEAIKTNPKVKEAIEEVIEEY